MIKTSIPITAEYSAQSREFYDIAMLVFRGFAEEGKLKVLEHASEWCQLLLSHNHIEVSSACIIWQRN